MKVVFFVIVALSASCKKKISTLSDLRDFVADPNNGLIKTQTINEIKAELSYRPWQLILASQADLRKLRGESFEGLMQNKYFFVLSLSIHNKELLRQLPFAQYSEMVQTLAFRMVDYVQIIPDQQKEVPPENCLFLQTYGIAQANQLLLVFKKARLENAKYLHIKIKEFGLGIGDLNFQMNTSNIHDLTSTTLK